MISAVVIDIDDTLCLTEPACFDLENEVLARLGRGPMTRDVHRLTWGMPLLAAMEQRSPGVDIEQFAAVYEGLLVEYVAAGRLDAVSTENLDALDAMAASGRQLMVLTSRTRSEVAHMLDAEHPLAARMTSVYHANNTEFLKPDLRVFNRLFADTGLSPQECVYVGDSPGDAKAANGAGIAFIATLEGGIRTREDFSGYHVAAFVERFPDVVGALELLDSGGAR